MSTYNQKVAAAAHLYSLMRRKLNHVIDVERAATDISYATAIIRVARASPHVDLLQWAERFEAVLKSPVDAVTMPGALQADPGRPSRLPPASRQARASRLAPLSRLDPGPTSVLASWASSSVLLSSFSSRFEQEPVAVRRRGRWRRAAGIGTALAVAGYLLVAMLGHRPAALPTSSNAGAAAAAAVEAEASAPVEKPAAPAPADTASSAAVASVSSDTARSLDPTDATPADPARTGAEVAAPPAPAEPPAAAETAPAARLELSPEPAAPAVAAPRPKTRHGAYQAAVASPTPRARGDAAVSPVRAAPSAEPVAASAASPPAPPSLGLASAAPEAAVPASAATVVVAPRLNFRTDCGVPPYPHEAQLDRATGQTWLRVSVGAEGRVGDIQVVRSAGPTRAHKLMDRALMATVRDTCKFVPGTVDGLPALLTKDIVYVWNPS